MSRRRLLSLYRRAIRTTYQLPEGSFPRKVRYNIREMMETVPSPRLSRAKLDRFIAEGEADLKVFEQLAQQPPAVFDLWLRKQHPAPNAEAGASPSEPSTK